jgi:hypothetical protein
MRALTFDPSPPLEDEEETHFVAADDTAKLMRWHYRLGHLSFAKLKMLAKNGEIPRRLARVSPPKCAGCLFGAMTKLPWHGKESKTSHEVFVASKPGECVSVDHMVSTQAGFYVQLKGKLTNKRYRAASMFVDHFPRLRFVHLMQDLSSEEMVNAKLAFERFAAEHGVKIKHYHCDNGRFADNAFKQSCEQSGQRLTFCGVNAHFQNGIAEHAIRDLSESARKQLLHTRQHWPAAVHTALWPYALRNAALMHNNLPTLEDGKSRLKLFSSIQVGAKMAHHHTFACPVFALQNALAAGSTIPKWSPRARLGLNLGQSPMHARNLHLVLNLSTGLVSPQYHCRFDDFFETMKYGVADVAVSSTWQQLAGFYRATDVDSHSSTSKLHSDVSREMPFDTRVPSALQHESEELFGFHENANEDSTEVTTPQDDPIQNQVSQENEGASRKGSVNTSAGVSRHGRVCTMSRRMADSVSQREFYGNARMHYMASQAALGNTTEDLFHDAHLNLQERM